MAEIVGGFATSPVLMSSRGVEEKAARVTNGMADIGRRIRALTPDALVVVTNDHMFNFNLSLQAPFLIGVDDSYTPFGEMDIPHEPHPGNRAFAEEFTAYAAHSGFDIATARGSAPEHGMAVPLMFVDPKRWIPIVPLYLDILMRPMPSIERCWRLGEVLRDFIEQQCTSAARVVILGTGGLSHGVGLEKIAVSDEWDRVFLEDMCAGRFRKWAQTSASEIEVAAGNGRLEIIHWLFMAAATRAWGGSDLSRTHR